MACIWVCPGHITKCLAALYIGAEKCPRLSWFRHNHCHFPICCTSNEGEFLSFCYSSFEAAAILWEQFMQHIKRAILRWTHYCYSFLICCFSRSWYCQSEKEWIVFVYRRKILFPCSKQKVGMFNTAWYLQEINWNSYYFMTLRRRDIRKALVLTKATENWFACHS